MAKSTFTSEEQLVNGLTADITAFWQQGVFEHFSGAHNVRINYAAFIQNTDVDSQKCLVISSGRSESYLKYQELSYDFFSLGYSVFLIDHRGQGLSGRELANPQKGYVDNFQYYVDDFAYFIDNIVSKHCADKPYLLAHSMGGAIAARYLQDYPERIQAAVLSSPMFGFNGGVIPDFIADSVIKTSAKINQWFDDTPWYFLGHKDYASTDFADNPLTHSPIRHEIVTELYKNTPAIQLGGVTTAWLTASLTGLEKLFDNINKISTPTLVLQAGGDMIVSNQAQNDFCKQLHQQHPASCPTGKPIVVADAFHELFFERDTYRQQALIAAENWFNAH